MACTDAGPRSARRIGAALLGLLVLYGCWQAIRWPAPDRELVGNVAFFPFDLIATAAAWAAARRCGSEPRLRSAWRLLAVALVANLLGDLVWMLYQLAGARPSPSVADVFYLLFYPLTLWGVLRFPTLPLTRSEQIRRWLDLGIVAVGGTVVVIYVYLGPVVAQAGTGLLEMVVSIAYPVGDAVLLVGVGSVLVSGIPGPSRRSLQLLAAALLLFVAADLIYGYIALHGTYDGGNPNDTLYLASLTLIALAAATQAVPSPTPTPAQRAHRPHTGWTPYVAVGGAFAVLLVMHRHDHVLPDLTVLVAVLVLVALVSIRQILAQRDLASAQQWISHQSLHDALTGLPNRALVMDRAEQMLARARRRFDRVTALYVDIDNFKRVNDTLGHEAGDQVLKVVAERLSAGLRDADTVGRLGGDEFVVLLDSVAFDAGPELVAERLRAILAQPIELDGHGRRLTVTASVGIAVGRQAAVDDLLRDADWALYEAKRAGKNRFMVFQSSTQTAARDRIELELDLKEALGKQQLFLLYQPIYDLRRETINGVEALLRWQHPERGMIGPESFVPIAEESGAIVPIGRWVLQAACMQAAEWGLAGRSRRMSVNVSARQFDDDRFVADVADALSASHLVPRALTLEITETALMRDPGATAPRLRELKALGVLIAIDDFGTGYSSLAYLREFEVDSLKIDRSFVADIAVSNESRALIRTLVQLGKTLGLETVGEGIEHAAQLRELQRQKCDFGQGFLFARPLAPEAIEELLGLASPVRLMLRP